MSQGTPTIYRPAALAGSTKACWLTVFVAFTLLYVLTAQRGVSWQDSGMFQWRVLAGDYSGGLGLALAHPLYISAGRAIHFVFGSSFPAALNAFSGIGMAVALANLSAVIVLLTGRRWLAVLTAATAGIAHTSWWLGTIAEVYTWTAAGLTAELWLLVSLIQRPTWPKLAGLALVSGLGWSLHNFALLALPVYLAVACWLVATRRLRARELGLAALAYVAGSAPYLAMIVAEAFDAGLGQAVRSALFGDYQEQVLATGGGGLWKANAALTAMNFINPLLPLAVVGWANMRRLGRPLALSLGAITFIHLLFFVRYPVPDQFTFVLPSLMLIALAAGIGADRLARVGAGWRRAVIACLLLSLAAGPAAYALAPGLANRKGVTADRRQLPHRDEARYWLTPWKHNERSAELFAAEALAQAQPDAAILADDTPLNALRLTQRLGGLGPQVRVMDSRQGWSKAALAELLAQRPMYVVSDDPKYLPAAVGANFELVRTGVLFRAYEKQPPSAPATTAEID